MHQRHQSILLARRGSALIVTMWVIIALTGLVLTLSFSMRTEAMASANNASEAAAEAAERGAEQFMLYVMDNEASYPGSMADYSMEDRTIGDCRVWIVRPDWQFDGQLAYGLSDEAGKIDLNTATRDMLLKLPGMTEDVADCIIDWRDTDSTTSAQGAEDDYYLSLNPPYHCKNGPLESVEELLLVKGVTRDLLFGYDRNRNGIIDGREATSGNAGTMFNAASDYGVGIYPFVTVYGVQATTASATSSSSSSASGSTQTVDVNSTNSSSLSNLLQRSLSQSRVLEIVARANEQRRSRPFSNVFDFYFRVGMTQDELSQVFTSLTAGSGGTTQPATPAPRVAKVNVNTASRPVLAALPELDDNDAAAIISHQQSTTTSSEPANIAWLVGTLSREKLTAIGSLVTGVSHYYSADIVAISGDGRAMRRYRIVINGQQAPSKIVYRKDLTTSGWPLPAEIRSAIRSGQQVTTFNVRGG